MRLLPDEFEDWVRSVQKTLHAMNHAIRVDRWVNDHKHEGAAVGGDCTDLNGLAHGSADIHAAVFGRHAPPTSSARSCARMTAVRNCSRGGDGIASHRRCATTTENRMVTTLAGSVVKSKVARISQAHAGKGILSLREMVHNGDIALPIPIDTTP